MMSWLISSTKSSRFLDFAKVSGCGWIAVNVSACCGERNLMDAKSELRGLVIVLFCKFRAEMNKSPFGSVLGKEDMMHKPVLSSKLSFFLLFHRYHQMFSPKVGVFWRCLLVREICCFFHFSHWALGFSLFFCQLWLCFVRLEGEVSQFYEIFMGCRPMELFLKNGFPCIILFVLGNSKNFSLNECFAIENVKSIGPRTDTSCAEATLTLLTSDGVEIGVLTDFNSW